MLVSMLVAAVGSVATTSRRGSVSRNRLDAFDDDRGRHAAAGAHRDEAELAGGALELVEHGADEDRAGGPDRVAEGHGTAVDVDLVAVELEVAHELLGHHCERLVHLEQV